MCHSCLTPAVIPVVTRVTRISRLTLAPTTRLNMPMGQRIVQAWRAAVWAWRMGASDAGYRNDLADLTPTAPDVPAMPVPAYANWLPGQVITPVRSLSREELSRMTSREVDAFFGR
jgi:hypothetical protein